MYVIKRTIKTQPGKAWEVAGYLTKICRAYEKEQGRNEAQVYIGGQGLPGEQNVVYAQWTQERIEPIAQGGVPQEVTDIYPKLAALMTEYTIDFYECTTPFSSIVEPCLCITDWRLKTSLRTEGLLNQS